MKNKITVIGIVAGIMLLGISFVIINFESKPSDLQVDLEKQNVDVMMPTKASRPGCELDDSCYIPSEMTIPLGQEVSWQNQDSAFHSVTSGNYGSPTELFDSGYMDPDVIFTVKFTEVGIYDYYCTLHPWMDGKIIVE